MVVVVVVCCGVRVQYCTSSVSSVADISLVCICLSLMSISHPISPSALTSQTYEEEEGRTRVCVSSY